MDISWAGVALAGALSFLSPCVLPLVVPYLCYMAGVSVEDLRAAGANSGPAGAGTSGRVSVRCRITLSALAFIAGFTAVFVALGASASALGTFLLRYQVEIAVIAAILIIIMGLNFLGLFRLGWLAREARFQTRNRPAGLGGAFIMGLAFAFGWTPCIGPILAPILTLAGSRATMGEGAALLVVYSLGLGLPFLLAALFSSLFMRFFMRFRRYLGLVEKFIGLALVITGLLFLGGFMHHISYWLLERFPALGSLG
ncbi:cytochrome c biogenesis CcdA family protein [Candidatus Tokpelaia sp.]|uniref:cytochrome c biogenesis CcdA family protein n=1 Tax=Candidatus Tokpelaia sp. TaxID=2233777 RepID=UPI0012393B2F|nr:cytochrome c biogenesis protein CcdA [Candidatus Tokpelaia sp.]KAA6404733.1 cytochrome c biogenesis protein CcdA [Candidatus Tokpelaia sp.]